MSLTHLKTIAFPEKFSITTSVEALLKPSDDSAYSLSMPLLMSAQLGNEDLYRQARKRMNAAMEKLEPGPFKAWLYGRILFAAQSIGDTGKADKTLKSLNTLLETLLEHDTHRLDRCTVWSLGYVAAINKEEYDKVQDPMRRAAHYLTNTYLEVNASTASDEKKQEARSDAIWAWVMIIKAAANAHDRNVYDEAIAQMLTITSQSSISQALTNGLLRTAASNDFPAWAIAIVRLATLTMGDEVRFKELELPLKEAIVSAKQIEKPQEALLAQINAQLAVECEKLMNQPPSSTPSMIPQ